MLSARSYKLNYAGNVASVLECTRKPKALSSVLCPMVTLSSMTGIGARTNISADHPVLHRVKA